MPVDIRRQLHDKLILDLENLVHSDGATTCYAVVQKIFPEFPTSVPAGEVMPTANEVVVEGLDSDTRNYTFTVNTYEYIEYSTDYTDAERKIDRLSDIEDRLFDYLQQIPHPIERAISGVHVYNVFVQPAAYSYVETEGGIRLYQQITFQLQVIIQNKTL